MCWFKKKAELKPEKKVQVTGGYVFNILNALLPTATHIYLSDSLYWLCSERDIENFLSMDTTNKEKYVSESFDCDDFSYRLMGQLSTPDWLGIAFGILWTEKHALNCLITDTGKFYFVEPQTDELLDKLQDWMGTEILFILM